MAKSSKYYFSVEEKRMGYASDRIDRLGRGILRYRLLGRLPIPAMVRQFVHPV